MSIFRSTAMERAVSLGLYVVMRIPTEPDSAGFGAPFAFTLPGESL